MEYKDIHGHKVVCSKLIKGMKYLTEPSFYPNSSGDCWAWTWADDDNIYLFGGDESAIGGGESAIKRKIGLPIKIEGIPPHHKCTALGSYVSAGNYPPKRSYLENTDYYAMASGAISIDGRIYLFVNKCLMAFGDELEREEGVDGNLVPGINSPHFNPVSKAYLIHSYDHGITFIGNAKDRDPEFFPHKFAWPTFIKSGRNNEDARDDYVYATSNDGYWDNGTCCYLGRVPKFRILDRDYWEFYTGIEGGTPVWAKDLDKAVPMFSDASPNFPRSSEFGHIGSFEVVYNKGLKRYLMLIWSYSDENGFKCLADPYVHSSEIQIYEAPEPWGSWSLVHNEHNFGPYACYNPTLPTKWMSSDGKTAWMLYSGNTFEPKPDKLYGIVTRQCKFELKEP